MDANDAPAVVDGRPVDKGLSYKMDYQLKDKVVE
jgi:hypothetical protein